VGALGYFTRQPVSTLSNIGLFRYWTRQPLGIIGCYEGSDRRNRENIEVFESRLREGAVNHPSTSGETRQERSEAATGCEKKAEIGKPAFVRLPPTSDFGAASRRGRAESRNLIGHKTARRKPGRNGDPQTGKKNTLKRLKKV